MSASPHTKLARWIFCSLSVVLLSCTACGGDSPDDSAVADTGGPNVEADAGDATPRTPDGGADVAEPSDTGEDVDDGGGSDVSDSGSDADAGASDIGPGGDAGDAADTGDADPAPQPDDLDPLGGQWSDDFSTPGMTGDVGANVSALLHISSDAIYAGGTFDVAGSQQARNVAKWNGFYWEPLGAGVDIHVNGLAFDPTGKLYAAGRALDGSTVNNVYRWDGTRWSNFGAVQPADAEVHDVVLLRTGDIIVAGDFYSVAGASFANLVKITTSGVQPVTAGAQPNGAVTDIEPTQSGFCVVGDFTQIGSLAANHAACWDGTSWSALGNDLPRGVHAMLSLGSGEYLAGGTFTIVDDAGASATGLAKFDGTEWAPYAGGVGGGSVTDVRAFYKGPNDEVYVGGTFDGYYVNGTGVWAGNIARLDGTTWKSLDVGVSEKLRITAGATAGVNAMTMLDSGELLVGGFYTSASDEFAVNIALWDHSDWHPFVNSDSSYLGVAGNIWTMVTGSDGQIYAGGSFDWAGRVPSENVAMLDGDRWVAMGDGLNDTVEAVAVDGDTVYAGGSFYMSGGNGVSYIARWDGSEWHRMGYGLDGTVKDLVVAPNGHLYAVGEFEKADGQNAGGVAYWNGGTWQTMGSGFDKPVNAIAIDKSGTIYVGGWFEHTANGRPIRRLARWDGTQWVEVGGGTSEYVTDLTFYKGDLAVVGSFNKAGGVTVNSVAIWDGSNFHALGNGVPPMAAGHSSGMVVDVEAKANGLFIAGAFGTAGTQHVENLAWWDGQAWHALENGIRGGATALLVHDHNLYVGGPFTAVSGYPSYGIARWEYGGL